MREIIYKCDFCGINMNAQTLEYGEQLINTYNVYRKDACEECAILANRLLHEHIKEVSLTR